MSEHAEHVHEWRTPAGPIYVIATNPPQHPFRCACGAFTHDPETGKPCPTCDPEDFARRSA